MPARPATNGPPSHQPSAQHRHPKNACRGRGLSTLNRAGLVVQSHDSDHFQVPTRITRQGSNLVHNTVTRSPVTSVPLSIEVYKSWRGSAGFSVEPAGSSDTTLFNFYDRIAHNFSLCSLDMDSLGNNLARRLTLACPSIRPENFVAELLGPGPKRPARNPICGLSSVASYRPGLRAWHDIPEA
jgi:hypothetical protein